jgi:signal transduction histidine kinase
VSSEAWGHLRILIVDDDEVDRRAVARALRQAGVIAEIQERDDVGPALAVLREGGRFDCVFLDYHLPGGDGLRVLREARELGVDAPFVVLTGREDTQTAVDMMKAGASDYLAKSSLSPERLEQSLRTAIRVHEAEVQARLAQLALRESEARFRVLHETSPDGFAIFRALRGDGGQVEDFEWIYANPAAERMAREGGGELVGRRLLAKHPGARETGLFDLYVEVLETGEPRQTEIEYGHEGLDLWLSITAVRLGDGIAVGFGDVSRRKRAELEREQAVAARNRFYAGISHELRTPINAILGYQDLLLAGVYGPIPEVQLATIERAQRSTRHLLELINDILDFSKLEAGKMELVLEEVEVTDIILEAFSTLQPIARERRAEIQFSQALCAQPIVTDPRRVRQILLNLLGNAVKYGAGNPIDVRCTQTQNREICIEVQDRGPGIAPADRTRIFEEFVRLVGSSEAGTGLGLPISKRLAELLGGRLEVDSVVGQGSVFRLILPGLTPVEAIMPSAS